MIVSGIWWKRAEVFLRPLLLLPLLGLGGCGVDQLLFGRPPEPPVAEPLPPSRGNAASQVDLSAGLAPLPSAQQVLTAVPFGRRDPFQVMPPPPAPAPQSAAGKGPATGRPGNVRSSPGEAAASGAAGSPSRPTDGAPARSAARPLPLRAPDGFRLTGVIRSGGQAEALVTYRSASGSLRPGDRGGRTTALLPSGWTLASIQFGGRTPDDPPSIILQWAGLPVKVSL